MSAKKLSIVARCGKKPSLAFFSHSLIALEDGKTISLFVGCVVEKLIKVWK